MQQTIVLLDELGERWGEAHTYYNLRSPAEALKLLCINYPDFKKYLATSHQQGIGYTVVQAGEYLDLEDLTLPLGANDLIIAPVLTGSGDALKNPWVRIIIGVAIIGLIAATGGFGAGMAAGFAGGFGGTATAAGAFGGMLGQALGYLAIGLIMGGISQLISPVPEPKKLKRYKSGDSIATDDPQSSIRGSDGRPSYAYGGASNNIGVGATVPVAYGKVLVGSHLASARIEVADESDPLSTYIQQPGPQTVRIGGDRVTSELTRLDGLLTKKFRTYGFKIADQGYVVNDTIDLEEGKRDTLGVVRGEEPSDNQYDVRKFQILLELPNGLFKFVSGPGTTKVDGFVTYRVEVFADESSDDGDEKGMLVGSIQASIQGLLLKTQVYRWKHQFTFQKLQSIDDYKVKLTVIDFSAEENRGRSGLDYKHEMQVLAMGYKLDTHQ